MSSLHPGVTFHEDDRGHGPFMIRVDGTNEFVANVQTGYYSRWGSPERSVTLCEGCNNPAILSYQTMNDALKAANQVWEIEGFHTLIEIMRQ